MKLIIVHYHFRPGGVRRVIEMAAPHLVRRMEAGSVLVVTGEAPDPGWLEAFRQSLAPAALELRVIPAFGYSSEQAKTGAELRREVRAGLKALPVGPEAGKALIWAHNLSLGRNPVLTRELARFCESRRVPLVAHHHDWWFENRWQRWAEIRRCGLRTLRSMADALFPSARYLAHATINQTDADLLGGHFPKQAHWLPNPAEPGSLPGAERLRAARQWIDQQLAPAAPPGSPLWLLPCRLLRRKNIAEALLLKRWLRPEAWLVTTGGPSSADEAAYAQVLEEAASGSGWRLRLGVLAGKESGKPSVPELMAVSEAILLTSIQEGFGLPNLEAAAAGRPLIARRLPNIAPDLARFGFEFPQSYEEVFIDPALFDWDAEVRRQAERFGEWKAHIPRRCRRWMGEPVLLAHRDAPQAVPFSRLTLRAQLEVLRLPAEESWSRCVALNPVLGEWKQRAAQGGLQVSQWPASASRALGGEAYAQRFFEIAASIPGPAAAPGAGLGAQKEFIRERLAAPYLFPLLWAQCT